MHAAAEPESRETHGPGWGGARRGERACQHGIGVLENGSGTGLNDNVLIELGSMMVTGRRCAMLKDRTATGLPSDLTAQPYKSVDFEDLNAVTAAAHRWVAEDLGLPRCGSWPA